MSAGNWARSNTRGSLVADKRKRPRFWPGCLRECCKRKVKSVAPDAEIGELETNTAECGFVCCGATPQRAFAGSLELMIFVTLTPSCAKSAKACTSATGW